MSVFSKWGNRLTAVVLLLLLVGAVVAYGVMPVVASFRTTEESLVHTEDLLIRFGQSAATRDAYRTQIKALSEGQTGSGLYVPGDTPALAAADLQERIRAAVNKSGGEIDHRPGREPSIRGPACGIPGSAPHGVRRPLPHLS